MKGDFTRFTHDPKKHYTGVLKQQGRVDLDADWNEQVTIQRRLHRTKAKDVIGICGVPKTGGGFEIGLSGDGRDLTISPGRMYVDGTLCEVEGKTTYGKQLDYHDPPELEPAEGRTDLVYLDVWQRHITAIEDEDIREVALGGPDTATRVKTVWQVKVLEGVDAVNCESEVKGWPPSPSGARLSTEVVPEPAGGYRGLENHLYRVEIHKGGDLGTATFKWSRDNGSVVFGIEEFVSGEPTKVKVKYLKRSQASGLSVGDWVEVLGDETELKAEPGTLVQILDISEGDQKLTLSADVSSHTGEHHPKVRRWDQESDASPVTAGPIDLEDGIRVRFSGNNFKTGDYWVFFARTATGDVERLAGAPPHGIQHHYCRLALITWQRTAIDKPWRVKIQDCRRGFRSLTDIGLPQVPETWPTIADISWKNDRPMPLKQFNEGLAIRFSEPMSPARASLDTFTVTLELAEKDPVAGLLGCRPFFVQGKVEVRRDSTWLFTPVPKIDSDTLETWLKIEEERFRGGGIRCRVVLKGNAILDQQGRPLDGDVFGEVVKSDTDGYIDLILPSGDGNKGGDFESWFYLVAGEGPLLDVNTATAAELASLPGVGPRLARAMVERRPYDRVEELLKVPGIGARKLDMLRELVTISGS